MATLEGKLIPDDVEVLIESMDYWETSGNREYHIMQMFKNMPLPEEDHEAFEPVREAKQYFANRERDIKADRSLRKEKATMLKAKLMLMRTDMAVDRIFDDVPSPSVSDTKGATTVPFEKGPLNESNPGNQDKLAQAEQFLKEKGIMEYYRSSLNGNPSTLDSALDYIETCGMIELWKEYLKK